MSYREEICERISLIVNKITNGNVKKFADGIDEGESRIRAYIKDKKMPAVEIIAKIAEEYAINCEWLLLGTGEMKNKPEVKITDANEYLVKRFEEVAVELDRKKIKIEEMEKQISELQAEKKEYLNYGIVAEPKPKLIKK